MTPTPFVFYGTLQNRDHRGSYLTADAGLGTYGGPVLIRGDLYDVGAFPALLPGNGTVKGQLWTPNPDAVDEAFRIFDRIESYIEDRPTKSMYLRRKVHLIEPEGLVAWVYIWNRSRIGLAPIPSGDWLAYQATRRDDSGSDYEDVA